jgi:uncharacterized OB-fold protein
MPEMEAVDPLAPYAARYWEAARQGELVVQQCDTCGRCQLYPRVVCVACHGGQLRWTAASGEAIVYTFSVVYRPMVNYIEAVPYIVAVVELEEGPKLMTRLVGLSPEDAFIGMRVTVDFEERDGRNLPVFRRSGESR